MEKHSQSWLGAVAQAAAWLASVGLILVDMLGLHYLFQVILARVGIHEWVADFWGRALLLVLACAGVVLAVVLEYVFRRSRGEGHLGRQTLRVVSIEAAIAILSFTAQAAIRVLA